MLANNLKHAYCIAHDSGGVGVKWLGVSDDFQLVVWCFTFFFVWGKKLGEMYAKSPNVVLSNALFHRVTKIRWPPSRSSSIFILRFESGIQLQTFMTFWLFVQFFQLFFSSKVLWFYVDRKIRTATCRCVRVLCFTDYWRRNVSRIHDVVKDKYYIWAWKHFRIASKVKRLRYQRQEVKDYVMRKYYIIFNKEVVVIHQRMNL